MNNAMRCGVVVAVMAATGVAVAGTTAAGPPVNYVILPIEREDNFILSLFDGFEVGIDVYIPGVGGVSAVTVDRENGSSMVLSTQGLGDGLWSGNEHFADLMTMKAVVHGMWTIHITATVSSTSTFIVNAIGLAESHFYPTPTNVFPPHASTQPPCLTFSWTDPTGAATPYFLGVTVESESFDEAGDNNINGTLMTTDTSWDPPVDLTPGFKQFGVFYIDVHGDLVSSLMVTSGAITWGNSPLVPIGYPDSTPLFGLGSGTSVGFIVVRCPEDVNGDCTVNVLDLIDLLLCFGQPAVPGCEAEDINADGTVNVLDLIDLLLQFGQACP